MENLGIWVYNLFHKDDKPYIEYIDNINSMGSAASNVAAALDETAGSINDVTDGINNALDDINTVGGGGSGSGSGGGGGDDQGGGGSGSNNIEWGSLENIYYSTALQGISMSIADIFRAAGYNAGSAWSMVDAYGSQGAFNWVNRNYLPNLDIGGTVMDSGIARVKQGEVWYNPAVGRPYGMDNNGMTVITTVNMNGEEIARQTDIYKSGQNALTSGTALPGGL